MKSVSKIDLISYAIIPNRGLITLSGPDRFTFLQGLISNDIYLLKRQPCVYSCLLTPNGKFLFDFFIVQEEENLLIECEGGMRAKDLYETLQKYKLRADINFEVMEECSVFAILCLDRHMDVTDRVWPDPRHTGLGYRTFQRPHDIEESDFESWDTLRISLGIPDGRRDMIVQKSTLLECNIDRFHGVSFEKGCYMGQELTARMHYRGLTKKTLLPVTFEDMPPAPFTDLMDINGKLIGEMRSSCGHTGLVLVRKDALEHPEHLPFMPL